MWWVWIVLFIIIVVLLAIHDEQEKRKRQEKETKERNQRIGEKGLNPEESVKTERYVYGHPDIDEPIEYTLIVKMNENMLGIYIDIPMGTLFVIKSKGIPATLKGIKSIESKKMLKPTDFPIKVAEIPISSIKDIVIEDASTIEKKVTLGRMLAVGLFAFALKKEVKTKLSYLTIKWNDGKFEHETIFEFKGEKSIENCNTARNKLIRIIR